MPAGDRAGLELSVQHGASTWDVHVSAPCHVDHRDVERVGIGSQLARCETVARLMAINPVDPELAARLVAQAEAMDAPGIALQVLGLVGLGCPELRGAVDRCDRRAVSHEVRVAVRHDDDVAGHQGHRTAVLFDPGADAGRGLGQRRVDARER